jgi:hypothetical protein
MATFNRQLVALDMLTQDMCDELALPTVQQSGIVSSRYNQLLQQYLEASKTLEALAKDSTEKGFSDAIVAKGICRHLVSKKMLLVQNRLLEYVVDYYLTADKLEPIRYLDFSEQAEIRFALLTTKSIKVKSQFSTVAKAMSKADYSKMINGIGLAEFDWHWDLLT